jgi:hypothetical protein
LTHANAKRFLPAVMVVVARCTLSTFSTASVTIYTSRAAWTAATSGVPTADFNGIAPVGSFVSYGSGPAVIDGLTFASNDSMFVIDPGTTGSFTRMDSSTQTTPLRILSPLPSRVATLR